MKYLLIIMIIPFCVLSQNIWKLRVQVRGNIDKFEVVDSNNIYCISDKGLPNYLDKSSDGGLSWFLVNDLTKYEVDYSLDIEVIDSLIYISFLRGEILKSTDYGKTFEKIKLGYKNFIYDIIMYDENNGIANMPLRLYKTNDGWKTFDTISFPFYFNMGHPRKVKENIINSILYIYEDEIYDEQGNPLIVIPTAYFAKINSKLEEFDTIRMHKMLYDDIEILNDSVYFLCGKSYGISGGSGHDAILKSTDAGKTWRLVLDLYTGYEKVTINNPFGLQDIAFKNDSTGIAVGQFGKILYTYDGGESWFYEQKLPNDIDSLEPPTMLVTYAGDRAIIGTFSGQIYTLEEDNLAPKPEDTLTISGKIKSKDSLAITSIPIRLNNNRITMTDSQGNYKFTKLASGTYTVTALNKYYDSSNLNYKYEPYLYYPVHTFELSSDTSGIDFNATNNRGSSQVTGTVMLNGEGLPGIEVILSGDRVHIDTTNEDGFFMFENIGKWLEAYKLYPNDNQYKYEPESYELYVNENIASQNFAASVSTSVPDNPNFAIRANILYSKDISGKHFKIISITGAIINEGALSKELNLNPYPSGTYILQITNGNEVIFTYKFQVVR